MDIRGFDHIVLCVRDIGATRSFYQRILGLEVREERNEKWSLHFGSNKISLQEEGKVPDLARRTVPGSGNFCLLTDTPISDVVAHLESNGIEIVEGPVEKEGAMGKLLSVYFRDPDQNLVEISNSIGRS